jgi:hypothetical protein
MKSIIPALSLLAVLSFGYTSGPALAAGSQPKAAKTEKTLRTCTGTLISADQQERTVTVKRFLFSRTFNLGDGCTVSVPEKPDARPADLRRGEWVTVAYRQINGVPVALKVEQSLETLTGAITAIDAEHRTLKLDQGAFTRSYTLAGDCKVRLRDGDGGQLDDLQVGHHVTVAFARASGPKIVRRIEQTSAEFNGRLTAIDLSDRTVKLRVLLGEKKFSVGGDCKIVVDGAFASLDKLDLDRPATVNYDEVDGIYIANRISQAVGAVAGSPAGEQELVGTAP